VTLKEFKAWPPDRATARHIADALSWSRIAAILPITALAWFGLERWVLVLYVVAALTDYFDGVFARRALPPARDIDLDGIADTAFRVMTVLWIWLLVPGFVQHYWLPYFPVLIVLEGYMVTLRMRDRDMPVPHLRFGRFAMALFFCLLPVLAIWGDLAWFVHAVLIVGTLSNTQLAIAMTRLFRARNWVSSAP